MMGLQQCLEARFAHEAVAAPTNTAKAIVGATFFLHTLLVLPAVGRGSSRIDGCHGGKDDNVWGGHDEVGGCWYVVAGWVVGSSCRHRNAVSETDS